jgi:hypothetical protein
MRVHLEPMPILRLAYIGLFLIAVIAVFTLWSQVGGQAHLDLVPWSIKLALGTAAALGITRAGAAAVQGEHGWNGQTVKWTGLALAALFLCGMASLYAHNNLEDTGEDAGDGDATVSSFHHSSARFDSARRLARSAPTSATTMRSPS